MIIMWALDGPSNNPRVDVFRFDLRWFLLLSGLGRLGLSEEHLHDPDHIVHQPSHGSRPDLGGQDQGAAFAGAAGTSMRHGRADDAFVHPLAKYLFRSVLVLVFRPDAGSSKGRGRSSRTCF